MLIVTQKPGSHLTFTLEDGRTIKVYTLGIHGQQSRVGIEADKTIAVHRSNIVAKEQKVKS